MSRLLIFLTVVGCSFLSCNQATLQLVRDALSNQTLSEEEVAGGLKQALEIGITKGSEALAAKDGYYKSPYKILLPPEARKITEKLQTIPGFSNVEEVILEKINRGAEDAASQAKPIFVNAIKNMTFSDAMNILMGEKDAATQYLYRTTFDSLYQAFNPIIVNSLDKFNARKYWSDAVDVYNKIPFVEKANPDLDDYVTRQALEGLFKKIAEEELNIRTNLNARTTDLLRKVFARQDAK